MRRIPRDTLRYLLAAAITVLGLGCVADESELPECTGPKCDAWNDANDPSNFGRDFQYDWDELKKAELAHGASEIVPWPDTYWPMQQDGYNDRWQGDSKLSPVELYDKAFNNWTPTSGFEAFIALKRFSSPGGAYSADYYAQYGKATKWAHERGGNYRARVLTAPDGTPQWDQNSTEDNVEWGGIEGWWGHCHAWAPAAFMAPEPQHAVTVNGVTFEVADIKALIEATYEGGNSMFLGGRCNTKDVERDANGRIIDDECRDTNAGAFHVVTLNHMGIRKLSFVLDATYNFEVWNQPARDYTITLQEEVDLAQALALIKRTDVTAYPYNTDAKRFVHVKMNFRYVVEGSASTTPFLDRIDSYTRTHNYEYLLELDGAGKIIGGEWINYSQSTHPDFLWLPIQSYGGNPSINMSNVRHLLELSRKTDEPAPTENVTEFGGDTNVAIPDNNPAGVTHTITVNDDVTIGALKVKLGIEHTYIGDLKVVLAKDGTEVVLHDRTGGGTNDINATIDVNEFNGMSAKGTWTLKISDLANRDTGTLKNLTLSVSSGSGGSTSERSYVSTQVMSIPDNDATGVTSVISVPDEGSIKGLKLTLDVTHTYVGDLTVLVEHGGQKQVLHSREGGSADDIKKTYTLTSFNGAPVKGDWRLVIKDEAGQDTGKLNTWTLVAEL